MLGEVHDIGHTAHVVDGTFTLQLFGHGHEVNGLVAHVEGPDGREDLLMARFVEGFWIDDLGNNREGILINHERTEYNTLYISSLWLQMAISTINGGRRTSAGGVLICLRHRTAKVRKSFYY